MTRDRLQATATYFNASGLVFLVAGRLLRRLGTDPSGHALPDDLRYPLGLVLALSSFPFWIKGISALAQSKGYSRWYGLFGLASFLGWTVVKLLPDRWDEAPEPDPAGDYPRPKD